jgi:membrane protease subunit HflC
VVVVLSSLFTVSQTEQAIVLRFGEPVPDRGLVSDPGLHFKAPFIETVVFLDKRILDLESSQEEVLTHDSQRLVVDSYLRYKITDPLKFYQTVQTIDNANNQLSSLLSSTVRLVLGAANLTDIVRDKREELMASIRQQVNDAANRLGVSVVDARIRSADFPDEIAAGVYGRMQTERQREAAQFRAQGAEQAQTIRATAEKDRTVLLAQAQQQADTTRGQGDAQSVSIFADAYSKDPDFFAFYRSMQAYANSLKSSNTRYVISPTSDFFRYFGNPTGAEAAVPAAPVSPKSPVGPQAQASETATVR